MKEVHPAIAQLIIIIIIIIITIITTFMFMRI